MTELKHHNQKFNWKAFFFPAAYFAGRGKVGKGIGLAIIGSLPVVCIAAPFWAGFKAKELQSTTFSWPKAISVGFFHLFLVVQMINGVSSYKKAPITSKVNKSMTDIEICHAILEKIRPSIERFNKLSAESDERVKLVYEKRFESESDKRYFRAVKKEIDKLNESMGGDDMNDFIRLECEKKGVKLNSGSK